MEGLLDDVDFDLDEMLGVEPSAPSADSLHKDRTDPRRKQVVCKHWLRDLCKRGDDCDFLHEYDVTRMPECIYFQHYGECPNKDCIFLHTKPDDKVEECPWFVRGFCKHGLRCRKRHTKRSACPAYLRGFCPLGPACELAHPKFGIPLLLDPSRPREQRRVGREPRDAQGVTCYRCWQKGHYANGCPNPRVAQPTHRGAAGDGAYEIAFL